MYLLLPEIGLILFIFYILIYYILDRFNNTYFSFNLCRLAYLVLFFELVILLYQIQLYMIADSSGVVYNTVVSSFAYYTINVTTLVLKIFILLISIICLRVFIGNNVLEVGFGLKSIQIIEYLFFFFTIILGSFFIISASNIMFLYLSIEILSISFYILIVSNTKRVSIIEGGFKFFFLSSFLSLIFLFGVLLFYGTVGTMGLNSITQIFFLSKNLPNYIFVFFLIFILFKLMIFPFYSWAPDVYENSHIHVLILLAVIPKIVFVFLGIKLIYLFLINTYHVSYISLVLLLSLLTLIIGTFSAFMQTRIRRLLAYSTIVHMAYVLFSFATLSIEGVFAGTIYIFNYFIFTIGILLLLSLFHEYYYDFNRKIIGLELSYIKDLFFIWKVNPYVLFCLVVLIFSGAGIPPLAGFFGKLFVLFSVIKYLSLNYAFIICMSAVVSCFYYLRLIKIVVNFYIIEEDVWSLYKIQTKGIYLLVFCSLYNLTFIFFLQFLGICLETIWWNLVLFGIFF